MPIFSPPVLPYDILQYIVEALHDDSKSLASCCLLNKEVNHAASATLYRKLDLRIGIYMGPGRGFGDTQLSDASQVLSSACLSHNRGLVTKVVLRGSFYKTGLKSQQLIRSFELFNNLKSIKLNLHRGYVSKDSCEVDSDCLASILKTLRERNATLHEIVLNSFAFKDPDEIKPLLRQDVRTFVLIKNRTFGHEARLDWLDVVRNCKGLNDLQIRTTLWTPPSFTCLPQSVERALLHLPGLRSLTLGLLIAWSDEHTFEVLSQLPHLEDLCLEYVFLTGPLSHRYVAQKLPITFTPLPRTIKSFTLRYKALSENSHKIPTVHDICKWIKHAISRCSLERLSYHPFYQPRTKNPKPKPSWDILVDHLADKHGGTLRELDLRAGFVRRRSVQKLLMKCRKMEELEIATSYGALFTFVRYALNVPALRKAQFELRTQRRDRGKRDPVISTEEAACLIKATPGLRRLIVNDDEFRASWALDENGVLFHTVEHN
ncbi:hypothetical protein Moror_1346 [Moniliophthora roreri MCA 2997]|uniref:F-box domain-containing protein n=2 Tax=Moniliophthora roreri TaxID=221103 RepID=V2WRR9_MONRO|nr:hypothetical protein Moror_1346 [Moniliophthora roreri MCA 2997]